MPSLYRSTIGVDSTEFSITRAQSSLLIPQSVSDYTREVMENPVALMRAMQPDISQYTAELFVRWGVHTPEALYRTLVAEGFGKPEARDMAKLPPTWEDVPVQISERPSALIPRSVWESSMEVMQDPVAIAQAMQPDISLDLARMYVKYRVNTPVALYKRLVGAGFGEAEAKEIAELPQTWEDDDTSFSGLLDWRGKRERLKPQVAEMQAEARAQLAEEEGTLLPVGIGAALFALAAL